MIFVQSDATAARRRFHIFLVNGTDGITAVTTEAGGQSQISKNGGAWTNTTATLVAVGNGSYYVELTATEIDTLGIVMIRYKSAATAEFALSADVVAVNINDNVRAGLTALPNAAAEAAGGLYTRGVGAGQINQDANGRVDTRTAAMAADVMTAAALAADFTVENTAPILAVMGALNNAASAGDPNTTNTLVQYLKQIVNTLEGTAGIPTYPAAASAANGVSLAEVIRSTNFIMSTFMDASISSRASQTSVDAVQADTDNLQTRIPAALVGGRMDANVGAMGANVVTAAALDPTAGAEIADAVWDEAIAGHLTAGSTGAALNGAGSAGDPWTTPLPGAYGAGTAGNLLGNLDDGVAALQADTDNIQTRLPAALVGGAMNSNVDAWKGNAALNTVANGNILVDVYRWVGNIPNALNTGRVDASVGAMAANVMTAAAADPTLANEIADQVWDEVLSGHLTAGTTGAALNGAGSAGDPWTTPLPGAYGAGTAGNIVGTNLNATVSSRATPSDVPTATQNADALLGRDLSAVVGAAARSPLNALRFLRNKWSVAAGVLTVTREDDSTTAWTAALTSDATAAPVTGSDPV